MSEVSTARKGLRTGWTTGTCASAAAKAGAIALLTGALPQEVTVALPRGGTVTLPVEADSAGRAVVVKDAGDDPDCTDGARMTAEVRFDGGARGPALLAGDGVGTVTRRGLGLPVGAPAINPVPRRMIRAALASLAGTPPRSLSVTFSVPGGETMAERTTNARLGIVGGISILGTTGIVRPFSTAAFRASVTQQVDVAAAQGERAIVLATGSRTQVAATRLFPELDPVCIVEVGDFTGIALRRAAAGGFRHATFVGMAGKITKLAAGVVMTHFHRSRVDTAVLATAARTAGAPDALVAAATETATARHFYEACVGAGTTAPLDVLCRLARATCESHAGGVLAVDVVMTDFDGSEVVARG